MERDVGRYTINSNIGHLGKERAPRYMFDRCNQDSLHGTHYELFALRCVSLWFIGTTTMLASPKCRARSEVNFLRFIRATLNVFTAMCARVCVVRRVCTVHRSSVDEQLPLALHA